MSPKEAVTPTACACDCEEYREEVDHEEDSEEDHWQNCECTFCGPVLEDGSRRCTVPISPVLMLAIADQSGFPKTGSLPAFCGNCRDHCLFVRRREAVVRAREARKHLEGQTGKERKLDSVLHRSRSRSRRCA